MDLCENVSHLVPPCTCTQLAGGFCFLFVHREHMLKFECITADEVVCDVQLGNAVFPDLIA